MILITFRSTVQTESGSYNAGVTTLSRVDDEGTTSARADNEGAAVSARADNKGPVVSARADKEGAAELAQVDNIGVVTTLSQADSGSHDTSVTTPMSVLLQAVQEIPTYVYHHFELYVRLLSVLTRLVSYHFQIYCANGKLFTRRKCHNVVSSAQERCSIDSS